MKKIEDFGLGLRCTLIVFSLLKITNFKFVFILAIIIRVSTLSILNNN